MIAVNVELQQQRRMTLAEINAAPTMVAFQRQDYIDDLSGGQKPSGTPQTLTAQRITLMSPTTQLPERRTSVGITVQPSYLLKAKWDADVERFDWFYIDGVKYEVVFIHPDRRYQTKAEVVYLG